MTVSIIVRTLNESVHLPQLLDVLSQQEGLDETLDLIVVDSGSSDGTVQLAYAAGARVLRISPEQFSFGRSLNLGCEEAHGDVLVFVSAHCIPQSSTWVRDLIAPIRAGFAVYSYGRQVGGDQSRYSERQIFNKYFPVEAAIPQDGFFCNNANAALMAAVWRENKFDESLTGLEDLHLAKRLVDAEMKIAYVAEATVLHLHDENWRQISRRFEREALALQKIMPEVQLSLYDVARYFLSAVALDLTAARAEGRAWLLLREILLYRFMQFSGAFSGNHLHRQLSRKQKELYYYPKGAVRRTPNMGELNVKKSSGALANEGQQRAGAG